MAKILRTVSKSFTVLEIYNSIPAMCKIKCNICGREKLAKMVDVYAFGQHGKTRTSIACPCMRNKHKEWFEQNVLGKIWGTRMKCIGRNVVSKDSEFIFRCEKCGAERTVFGCNFLHNLKEITCLSCEDTKSQEEKMKSSIWRLVRRERAQSDFVEKGKIKRVIYACKNCGKEKARRRGGVQRLPQKCPHCGFSCSGIPNNSNREEKRKQKNIKNKTK